MPATARPIVMMERDEKASLEAYAKAANVSTTEFVRRRLFGRAAPEAGEFLQMLAELTPSARLATAIIDANLAEIRSMRADGTERADHVQDARADPTRDERAALAARLGR